MHAPLSRILFPCIEFAWAKYFFNLYHLLALSKNPTQDPEPISVLHFLLETNVLFCHLSLRSAALRS